MNHELHAARGRARDRFLRFPTVIGVGVGPKLVAGKITAREAIVVYVSKKLPRKDVPKGELVPRTFEGFPTDVREPVLQIVKQPRGVSPPGDWCRTADAQWIDWVKIHALNVARQPTKPPRKQAKKRRRTRGASND